MDADFVSRFPARSCELMTESMYLAAAVEMSRLPYTEHTWEEVKRTLDPCLERAVLLKKAAAIDEQDEDRPAGCKY